MNTIYAYTRQFLTETGASMHLALKTDCGLQKLNHGFGVLFPEADRSFGIDGKSKGLVQPWLFRTADGKFGVAALRRDVNERGRAVPEEEYANTVLLFTSDDLTEYTEHGLFMAAEPGEVIDDVRCAWQADHYLLQVLVDGSWHALTSTTLGDFKPCDVVGPVCERPTLDVHDEIGVSELALTEEEAAHLLRRLTAPVLPDDAPEFPFPFMPPRGDPMAIRWQGGYLFMATDDERDQRALKIRFAQTLGDIAGAEDHVILRANDTGDYSGCLWAPELHWVGERLCIFFAAGMPHWYTVQSRVMWLTGDDPLDAACWSAPRRIERADGTNVTDEGITLDMTVVPSGGRDYVIWSQRPMFVTEQVTCGTADLMIAQLNSEEPWRLASDPVLLSWPEYGWERIHSPVNEGPYLLRRGDRLYVTYAAALIDHTYAVGLLWAEDGAVLTDPSVWHKSNYPVLHRLSMPDQLGAGHNAFVKDEQGRDIMLIHALSMENYLHDPKDGRRYPCLRMVVWDDEGFPHFDAQ